MSEQIRRVAVWSGWLRLTHWCLAGATLVLLVSGWLIGSAPSLAAPASDAHYLAASILIFALVMRLFLGLSGRGAERFEHMLPRASETAGMRASLLFYLSLGRTPLPNWFAHNPLWKPIYLVLFVLLGLLALSGWLMPDMPVIGSLYLPRVHSWLANAVALASVAHLYSVVLQDVKGRTADISAMFSGHRYFSVERPGPVTPEIPPVSIRLGEIGGASPGSERKH